MNKNLFNYILQLGDNSLILGQRLTELCGHGPSVELDMALSNIGLDLLGQTRSYFQYAATLEGKGRTEDDLAFLRDVRSYRNVLLVEQPNEDFAHTIMRQFFFDGFHLLFLEHLCASADEQLAAIAQKSLKEVRYHWRFSSNWVIRLGDGTPESHRRMQTALDDLWQFTKELFEPSEYDTAAVSAGIGVDLGDLRTSYLAQIAEVLTTATLQQPDYEPMQSGGKRGIHSEHFGHLISSMQWMQRSYPKMQW